MDQYDVIVIGGGIHGAGAAQAAAAAGYSVLLLEKNSLAYGSSSRSSKLIHGGLRYLESAQFHLVYECLHERHLLMRLAPELVQLERFYIPVYDTGSRSANMLRAGLTLYALLGGLRPATFYHKLARHQWSALDGLNPDGLQAVFQYHDARTDDSALTHAVMRSAVELGAESVIPAEFLAADCEPDAVSISYRQNGITKHCRAGALVNATGAWINPVLQKISPCMTVLPVDLVQGTHLVLADLPVRHCFYFESPLDKRAIFLLPWKTGTLLGTTETHFDGLPDHVQPLQKEIDYLMKTAAFYFPHRKPDIIEAFAGLRVLPAGEQSDFDKPRDTVLYRSHERVINVYGGKLTTYRLTARRIIKQLQEVLPNRRTKASTDRIKLHTAW